MSDSEPRAGAKDRDTEDRVLRQASHMRALTGLYQGLVHDLKSPINALVVNLELLKTSVSETPDLERQRRYIQILNDELMRLNQAVERLLPAAGPTSEERGRFDLKDLVAELAPLLSTTARHQSVRLEIQAPEGRLLLDAHRDRIKQAFLALSINALEAMPKGGRLEIGLERRQDRAILSVSDSGPGVADSVRDRMFDLYSTTKERHEGIGLYVARSVVESTNGSIEHVPRPEGGSRFTLTLPLAA
jgi:signal transduction histidine kinase